MVSTISSSNTIVYPTPASIVVAQASANQTTSQNGYSSSDTAPSTTSSATNITISAEAEQALANQTAAENDFAAVIASARANLAQLLSDAEVSSPVSEGKLTVNLSNFDNRELFAIATNADNGFPQDQQEAAELELQRRSDDAIAVAIGVFNVTDDLSQLYQDVKDSLADAGPEEQATSEWIAKSAAVDEALATLDANPDAEIKGIENDPITNYLDRVESGQIDTSVSFASLGQSARKALDAQIAAAKENGQELSFTHRITKGQKVDFGEFDSRTLSAVALNEGGDFTTNESRAAKHEMSLRSGQAVLAALQNAGDTGDVAGFSKNLLTQYGSMSTEEREVAGWSSQFYDNIVSNYKSSSQISSMLTSTSGSSSGFFG